MKFKSLSIFLIISSFFLTCILSIWKIMSTLQGLSFTNLNITPVFSICILLSLAFVLIGKKINHLIKIFSISFLFSILYFYLNEASPYWYILGTFLISLFIVWNFGFYERESLFLILLNTVFVFMLYIFIWTNVEYESSYRYLLNIFHVILLFFVTTLNNFLILSKK